MKKNERLLNIIGQIDDALIEEAAPGEKRRLRTVWVKWLPAAACFAAVLVLFIVATSGKWFSKGEEVELSNGQKIRFAKAGALGTSSSADIDAEVVPLGEEQARTVFGSLPFQGNVVYAPGGRVLGFTGAVGEVNVIISVTNATLRDTVVVGKEETSEVNGVTVTAGYFLTDKNSKGIRNAIYYASFRLGNSTVYLENAGGESNKETVKQALGDVLFQLIEMGEPLVSALE